MAKGRGEAYALQQCKIAFVALGLDVSDMAFPPRGVGPKAVQLALRGEVIICHLITQATSIISTPTILTTT